MSCTWLPHSLILLTRWQIVHDSFTSCLGLVHYLLITCSCPISLNLFMTWAWLAHEDLCITCSQHVPDSFMTGSKLFIILSQHVHDLFTTSSQLFLMKLLMTCSWQHIYDLFMTYSQLLHNFFWLVHDFSTNFSWLFLWVVHELFMTCSLLVHDLHMTCSWLAHYSRIFSDLFTTIGS